MSVWISWPQLVRIHYAWRMTRRHTAVKPGNFYIYTIFHFILCESASIWQPYNAWSYIKKCLWLCLCYVFFFSFAVLGVGNLVIGKQNALNCDKWIHHGTNLGIMEHMLEFGCNFFDENEKKKHFIIKQRGVWNNVCVYSYNWAKVLKDWVRKKASIYYILKSYWDIFWLTKHLSCTTLCSTNL